MKLFDTVKKLLEIDERFRNSDAHLCWAIWMHEGSATKNILTMYNFLGATPVESITRARRKVQEMYPRLQAKPQVKERRESKEMLKGTFIMRENI